MASTMASVSPRRSSSSSSHRRKTFSIGMLALIHVVSRWRVSVEAFGFIQSTSTQNWGSLRKRCSLHRTPSSPSASSSVLWVSIGLGPSRDEGAEGGAAAGSDGGASPATIQLQPGVDYPIPNHEEYRLSRRSRIDEQCDAWFERLLMSHEDGIDENGHGILKEQAQHVRRILTTPVPLVNEIERPRDDPEWTPYVSTRLPWAPLTPAYGLEMFGLPIPRRNAEAWRHFEVSSMVSIDYGGGSVDQAGHDWTGSAEQVAAVVAQLQTQGAWLDDEACEARLIYINGRYAPQLSKTSAIAVNLGAGSAELDEPAVAQYLSRLTDGFTDELVVPVRNGQQMQTLYSKLSGPNHAVGNATSQFAINGQQGTACFAALNTIKTQAVAYVHAPTPEDVASNDEQNQPPPRPVLIVRATTPAAGANGNPPDATIPSESSSLLGVAMHPRTLIVAERNARLSVVQSCVDLKDQAEDRAVPKLYNGYTQIFIGEGANVTHSYLEEGGGLVTPESRGNSDAEGDDDGDKDSQRRQREIESQRPELLNTHLEAIDVHVMGEKGSYQSALVSVGGNGHVRLALSVALLATGAEAHVNGFSLAGGLQRTDMKTNIHHVAQGTISNQVQKNMIGGWAIGSFRGRVRVEQSAQQTDSAQLSRTILLSDKAHAWAVPSLEIIADDVKCSHGATVSDLSEEELFYLRSRGLDQKMARNMLMYAFAGDIVSQVDPAVLGSSSAQDNDLSYADQNMGLQQRVLQRLRNVVPQGERAVKGEFQSI